MGKDDKKKASSKSRGKTFSKEYKSGNLRPTNRPSSGKPKNSGKKKKDD